MFATVAPSNHKFQIIGSFTHTSNSLRNLLQINIFDLEHFIIVLVYNLHALYQMAFKQFLLSLGLLNIENIVALQ